LRWRTRPSTCINNREGTVPFRPLRVCGPCFLAPERDAQLRPTDVATKARTGADHRATQISQPLTLKCTVASGKCERACSRCKWTPHQPCQHDLFKGASGIRELSPFHTSIIPCQLSQGMLWMTCLPTAFRSLRSIFQLYMHSSCCKCAHMRRDRAGRPEAAQNVYMFPSALPLSVVHCTVKLYTSSHFLRNSAFAGWSVPRRRAYP
jgi:hypothetical protein